MSIVLKEFPWSPNGYTVETLKAGDERDFGVATNGLIAEGYIEPVADAAPVTVEPVIEPAIQPVVETPAVVVAPEVVEPVVNPVADAAPKNRKPRK